mgnify:CR=1 FL=1
MDKAFIFVVGMVAVGLMITSIFFSITCLRFFLEAGLSAMTNTYVLCHTNNHTNETLHFDVTCPQSWGYSSYEEALIEARKQAGYLDTVWHVLIIGGIIIGIINTFLNPNNRNGYTSV